MSRISIKNNEKLLIDEYKEKKYYCPHCRILFKKDAQDYTIEKVGKSYDLYKCTSCNKNFKNQTYKEKNKNGKHYHLEKNKEIIKKDIREHIKQAVVELWMEGYNISDIHSITNFSKTLIEEKTKEFRNENTKVYTFEEFENILESEEDRQDYNLVPWRDRRTRKIRKALWIGCSVSQLVSILKMGNSTISNARNKNYLFQSKYPREALWIGCSVSQIASISKMGNSTIVDARPKDYKFKYIYPEENRNLRVQIDIFIKNSVSTGRSKEKTPQRRTVQIDKENQTITILGMTAKQKKEFEEKK